MWISQDIKITPEAWKKIEEADNAPVDMEAIQKFIEDIQEVERNNNFTVKQITEVDNELP